MGFTWKGTHYSSIERAAEANDSLREHLAKEKARGVSRAARAKNAKRMALADKIVMAVVDQVCAAIIRPGPKPEERECYVVAQELRDFGPELREIVASILKIEAEEPAP